METDKQNPVHYCLSELIPLLVQEEVFEAVGAESQQSGGQSLLDMDRVRDLCVRGVISA